MRRIAIINQKGGVGKTTTTVNLGAALAQSGKRVLLVDLDPQSHLTLHLGIDPATRPGGAYEALTQSTPLDQLRKRVAKNLWLIGSHIDLAAAEVELVSVVGREVILRDLLDAHKTNYDYVLMDCPPSLGVLTLNALCAANEIFIPLQPHYLALHGLSKLLETVSLVARRINPPLRVTGVVVCMHEAGTRLASEVLEDVGSFLHASEQGRSPWAGARIFKTLIRRNIKLAECPSHGMTIFDYAPKSNGAEDYASLTVEVRAMVEADAGRSSVASPTAPAEPAAVPVLALEEPPPVVASTPATTPPAPGSPPPPVTLAAGSDGRDGGKSPKPTKVGSDMKADRNKSKPGPLAPTPKRADLHAPPPSSKKSISAASAPANEAVRESARPAPSHDLPKHDSPPPRRPKREPKADHLAMPAPASKIEPVAAAPTAPLCQTG